MEDTVVYLIKSDSKLIIKIPLEVSAKPLALFVKIKFLLKISKDENTSLEKIIVRYCAKRGTHSK